MMSVGDATALYYTFSTVAQTLAAALAVLAAFLLFRLPGIEATFGRAGAEYLTFTTDIDSGELRETAKRGGWAAVETRLKEDGKELTPEDEWRRRLRRQSNAVYQAWQARRSALSSLRWALGTSALAIGGSLLALPYVPILKDSPVWSTIITGAVLMLSFVSFYLDYRLIQALVDPRRRGGGSMARVVVIAALALALTGCLGALRWRNAAGREPSSAEVEECDQKAERSTAFADTLRDCLWDKGYRPVKN